MKCDPGGRVTKRTSSAMIFQTRGMREKRKREIGSARHQKSQDSRGACETNLTTKGNKCLAEVGKGEENDWGNAIAVWVGKSLGKQLWGRS